MKLTPHTLILVQLREGIYALADRLVEKTQSASPKGIKGPFMHNRGSFLLCLVEDNALDYCGANPLNIWDRLDPFDP